MLAVVNSILEFTYPYIRNYKQTHAVLPGSVSFNSLYNQNFSVVVCPAIVGDTDVVGHNLFIKYLNTHIFCSDCATSTISFMVTPNYEYYTAEQYNDLVTFIHAFSVAINIPVTLYGSTKEKFPLWEYCFPTEDTLCRYRGHKLVLPGIDVIPYTPKPKDTGSTVISLEDWIL